MWLAFGSQVRELRNGDLVVGSGAEADWRIADADLKPRHFVLTIYDLNASLKPADRASVVVVNGVQVTSEMPRLLNDGDVVRAGSGRFLFSEGEAREDDVAPADENRDVGYLIDERTGVAHPLRSRSVGIGRDGSNAVIVADPTVSRFHAEVRREAGGFALHARGMAGTVLNGQRVDGARLLGEGDVVEIASAKWRFQRTARGEVDLSGSSNGQASTPLETGHSTAVSLRAVRSDSEIRTRHGWVLWTAIAIAVVALLSWFVH